MSHPGDKGGICGAPGVISQFPAPVTMTCWIWISLPGTLKLTAKAPWKVTKRDRKGSRIVFFKHSASGAFFFLLNFRDWYLFAIFVGQVWNPLKVGDNIERNATLFWPSTSRLHNVQGYIFRTRWWFLTYFHQEMDPIRRAYFSDGLVHHHLENDGPW